MYTHKQFVDRLQKKHRNSIKLIGKYTKMANKHKFKCKVCFHAWSTTADSLVNNGSGCPKCKGGSGLDKKSDKQYKKEVSEISNNRVKVIDKYIDNATKIRHQCIQCNNIYSCVPLKITCVECKNKSFTKTNEQYKLEVLSLFKGDVSVLDEYKGAKIKIIHKCNNCSNEWKAYPTHVLKGQGCTTCATKGSHYKNYALGNRVVKVQGYEPIVLNYLVKQYKIKDIRVFSEGVVPTITYKRNRRHFPDIYIPRENTIIEVKSNSSLGMTCYYNAETEKGRIKLFKNIQAKAIAAIKQGYVYKLMLAHSNNKVIELPENWQHLSYSKFRKLWLKFRK